MLNLFSPGDGRRFDRREMLKIGGLTVGGVGLPQLLAAQAQGASPRRGDGFGRAKNCIILYLSGGNPQHDMYDPKPDTPAEIRGEFSTIATSTPTVRFGEHCRQSAKIMDRLALVRSMYHDHSDHARGSYQMFTGTEYAGSVPDANSMSRQDMPHLGSVVAKLAPGQGPMFPFVLVPHRMDVAGGRRVGQFAGMLGSKFDPMLTAGNPNDDDFRLRHLPLQPNEQPAAFRRRLGLLEQLNGQTEYLQEQPAAQSLTQAQTKALEVISSKQVRQAVDLASIDPAQREFYGRNLFGQSVLLGRRLLEAGSRLVQCNWQRTQGINGFAWDTHWNNFSALKDDLIPPFDQAFYALITDLEKTGQLDETLVVQAAEFGRSPKVTLKNGGREHWPQVYTVAFAGAGICGGQVYGASDKQGAFPAESPVTPADFVATIYHFLGIDPKQETHDQLNRPFQLSKGSPIPLEVV
ncbi:DUF1501 domain-containing protein [Lignipirellula cremea]|uniref:DUF1501 domain-containing protein n=1 Tax=Lignipirellula cremea TaxID=2528010 RepID=A0A518E0D7_9BACT|nr:DUF1501 domain-containing protein [Lignipirellula cremea]QDU97560.1 hypothetical protein Pla8534_54090 [Lignipirellula cremea]